MTEIIITNITYFSCKDELFIIDLLISPSVKEPMTCSFLSITKRTSLLTLFNILVDLKTVL